VNEVLKMYYKRYPASIEAEESDNNLPEVTEIKKDMYKFKEMLENVKDTNVIMNEIER